MGYPGSINFNSSIGGRSPDLSSNMSITQSKAIGEFTLPRYFSSSPGSLFTCQFEYEFVNDTARCRPDDWVGLFPCGWRSLTQCVEQCTIGDAERSARNSRLLLLRFTAPSSRCTDYQFLYVSAEGQVLVISCPVSFGSDPAESSGQSLVSTSLMSSVSLDPIASTSHIPTSEPPSEPAESWDAYVPSAFLLSTGATTTSNQGSLAQEEVQPFVDRECAHMTDIIDSWIPEVQIKLRTKVEGMRQRMVEGYNGLIEENRRLRQQLAQVEADKRGIRDQAERASKEMLDKIQSMTDRILQLESEKKELLSTVSSRLHSSSLVSMSTTTTESFFERTNDSSHDCLFESQASESVSVHENESPSPAVMPVTASQMSKSRGGRVVFLETEQPLSVGDHQKDLQDCISRQQFNNSPATGSFAIPRHSPEQLPNVSVGQNGHTNGNTSSESTGLAHSTSGPVQTT